MSGSRLLDWRGIVAGLAIAAACTALGGAVDVRDRVAKGEAALEKHQAVQDEQYGQIKADLAAIKTKLGIVP